MSQKSPELTSLLIDWMYVIRGEFEEVPGLQVTLEDAQDRWALDGDSLSAVLDTFVEVGILERSADGRYARPRPLEVGGAGQIHCRAV
jgi:hypothetical protein